MRPIKRILCPTDFSDCAAEALRFAIDTAEKFEASITLLHVYGIPAYPLPEGGFFGGPSVTAELVRDATEQLERLKQQTARSVPAHVELREGVPASEICRFAREGDFDLIVIGTHGRTGIRHLLLGSVAEVVVRKAPCAVLTVRSAPSPQPEAHPNH